jgi:dTDP-4-dehydrorhamnose 3,5-epimerase
MKMIEGVAVEKLRVVPDERGRLTEILRSDSVLFNRFGQVYATTTYRGVIKAWHKHRTQEDNVTCLTGMIKLVLYDGRESSATRGEIMEVFVGEHNPVLVHIPAGVFHGWKCISEQEACMVNVPTELYDYQDPDEYRLPVDSHEIPYEWEIKMG